MAQNVNLNTDPQTLKNCGAKMMSEATAFNSEVSKLYNVIIPNLENAWTGERAKSFIGKIKEFKTSYEEFGKLIDQLGQLIQAVGQDYENFEKGTY